MTVAWRRRLTILSMMSPWLIGMLGLLRLPARHDGRAVLRALRPAVTGEVDRPGQLPVHGPGRELLARRPQHALDDRDPGAGDAGLRLLGGAPGQQGAPRSRDAGGRSSTCRPWPRRSRRRSGSSTSSTRSTGPVDQILKFLHLPQPLWFDDPHWAKPTLTILAMWGIGSIMVIFLAALLDVPAELYEAADLDGVGRVAADALHHPADGQPGAAVRGDHRGHRRAAVLHPGLRRGHRGGRR